MSFIVTFAIVEQHRLEIAEFSVRNAETLFDDIVNKRIRVSNMLRSTLTKQKLIRIFIIFILIRLLFLNTIIINLRVEET